MTLTDGARVISRCLVPLTAVATLAFVSACDAFAIRCNDDGDCPNDLPFCVDDICVDEDEAERRGREVVSCEDDEECPSDFPLCDGGACVDAIAEGEGEGEGESCTGDGDCPGGLCWDVTDETGLFGTCVPRAVDEDCASQFSAPARDAAGPVIVDLQLLSASAGSRTVELHFLDRQGDVSPTSPLIFVRLAGGSGQNPLPSVSPPDGTSASMIFSFSANDGESVGIQLFDQLEHPSNTLCQHPAP